MINELIVLILKKIMRHFRSITIINKTKIILTLKFIQLTIANSIFARNKYILLYNKFSPRNNYMQFKQISRQNQVNTNIQLNLKIIQIYEKNFTEIYTDSQTIKHNSTKSHKSNFFNFHWSTGHSHVEIPHHHPLPESTGRTRRMRPATWQPLQPYSSTFHQSL